VAEGPSQGRPDTLLELGRAFASGALGDAPVTLADLEILHAQADVITCRPAQQNTAWETVT